MGGPIAFVANAIGSAASALASPQGQAVLTTLSTGAAIATSIQQSKVSEEQLKMQKKQMDREKQTSDALIDAENQRFELEKKRIKELDEKKLNRQKTLSTVRRAGTKVNKNVLSRGGNNAPNTPNIKTRRITQLSYGKGKI